MPAYREANNKVSGNESAKALFAMPLVREKRCLPTELAFTGYCLAKMTGKERLAGSASSSTFEVSNS
jgi:hypothetical protein